VRILSESTDDLTARALAMIFLRSAGLPVGARETHRWAELVGAIGASFSRAFSFGPWLHRDLPPHLHRDLPHICTGTFPHICTGTFPHICTGTFPAGTPVTEALDEIDAKLLELHQAVAAIIAYAFPPHGVGRPSRRTHARTHARTDRGLAPPPCGPLQLGWRRTSYTGGCRSDPA
jgi:hypothetical protein